MQWPTNKDNAEEFLTKDWSWSILWAFWSCTVCPRWFVMSRNAS
jgi:hypothetical protein